MPISLWSVATSDHVARLGLTDRKFVLRGIKALHQLHKRLDGEGIVLRGHAELALDVFSAAVFIHQAFVLMVELTGIEQEFRAVLRRGHAAAGAVEQHDAQLLFQLPHRAGERGLRKIQLLGGAVERACLRDDEDIMELLQRHGLSPPCGWISSKSLAYRARRRQRLTSAVRVCIMLPNESERGERPYDSAKTSDGSLCRTGFNR